MDSRITRPRLVALVLAVALAVETAGVVAASMPAEKAGRPAADPTPSASMLVARAKPGRRQTPVVETAPDPVATAAPAATEAPSATPAPEPTAKPKKAAQGESKAKAESKSTTKAAPKATPKPKPTTRKVSAKDFRGSNHVWIPALGISRSVSAFPCERVRPPDNYMYRWGCAGSNNVYLMGHSYSVMKPLYNAYYSGRLKVGMKAYYAGSNGKVRTYAVRWWKKTLPTPDASWAWAEQAEPSMTLQTCVGKNSKYRLMVRLVEVDG